MVFPAERDPGMEVELLVQCCILATAFPSTGSIGVRIWSISAQLPQAPLFARRLQTEKLSDEFGALDEAEQELGTTG